MIKNEDHREIKGKDFAIDYFEDSEEVSNKMISLYGENGLFALVVLATKYNWQIFDNGFDHFQDYLKQILNENG